MNTTQGDNRSKINRIRAPDLLWRFRANHSGMTAKRGPRATCEGN
jgi:hypothetical protein